MASKHYKKLQVGHFEDQNPFLLLRTSLDILIQNPILLFPSSILVFIQLFIIEILYFAPQYPLSHFFAPLIRQIWSEEYLHYPLNLVLLPKMFYYAQVFIYLFLGSFLLAITTRIISILNDHPRVNLRDVIKGDWGKYVHILAASLISFVLFHFFAKGYVFLLDAFIKQNPMGQSAFFWNRMLLWTIPYGQFLVGILSTVITVYLIPIIIIDKTTFYKALLRNFKVLMRAFPLTFLFVATPTMLYLPLLTVRNNISMLMNAVGPEIQIAVIVVSLLISMAIDLLIVTSSTVFYLYLRENS